MQSLNHEKGEQNTTFCKGAYRPISATRSYHSYDLVADMDFAQCNKLGRIFLQGSRVNTQIRYDVVALNCFNANKYMHYCTYDLVAFLRYDLVALLRYDLVVLMRRYYWLCFLEMRAHKTE